MTEEQFAALRVGDLVRYKRRGDAYVVVDEVRKIAVRTVNLSNPAEWDHVDRGGAILEARTGAFNRSKHMTPRRRAFGVIIGILVSLALWGAAFLGASVALSIGANT